MRSLLAQWPAEFSLVGEAADAEEGLHLAERYEPAVVLLNAGVSGLNGMEGIRTLKHQVPRVSIIVMTATEDEETLFYAIKYGAAAMLKAGQGGSIINTASVAGVVGFAGHSAYSASKAACLHLSKTAALELAKSNIRVNAIAPAFTATPMVDELAATSRNPERAMIKLAQAMPLGRLGTPEEIANGALFLASDESSFVTGTVLILDGGLTAQ